jgi:hypothetical protein
MQCCSCISCLFAHLSQICDKLHLQFPLLQSKQIFYICQRGLLSKFAQSLCAFVKRHKCHHYLISIYYNSFLRFGGCFVYFRSGNNFLFFFFRKMCIKSERRFDFLKELVSTVPDLQGDHDEPTGLDLTTTSSAMVDSSVPPTATTRVIQNHTSITAARPPRLPRQLSTPRPR